MRTPPIALALTLLAVPPALADTADVTWREVVRVEKQGEHCVDDPNCFNRYHPQIPTVANANPGDRIVIETRDALDSDLTLDSNEDDLVTWNRSSVH